MVEHPCKAIFAPVLSPLDSRLRGNDGVLTGLMVSSIVLPGFPLLVDAFGFFVEGVEVFG